MTVAEALEDLHSPGAGDFFGRITDEHADRWYIGRRHIEDDAHDPVVVDWRAPIAAPFYRATGVDPLGLSHRRRFTMVEGDLSAYLDEQLDDPDSVTATGVPDPVLAEIGAARTGAMREIVATIQAEQDVVIRASLDQCLVVQGGPGTGKTVVALHRAAYLLYTYRFPLEDQGVLVIGPNRVFLRYIEQVLPSLGEAGIEQVVLGDLVPDVDWARYGVDAPDSPQAATVKGNIRMADVIDQAVTDRERPLRADVVVPFRTGYLRLRAEETQRIVRSAQRRFRRHNAARRWVEGEIWSTMAATWRDGTVTARDVREAVRPMPEIREALERMWPLLTPAQLLHDLFGSKALLRLAAAKHLDESDYLSLYRPRHDDVATVRWTDNDVALLDEARSYLGSKPAKHHGQNGQHGQHGQGAGQPDNDEIRTYGHIVVDEVQDLTPMQLRMVSRRSLNGSMTVVGDIAQATGALAPDDWADVLRYLPDHKPSRVIGLSVGYRIPAQIMALANQVMLAATPTLRAPTSVRQSDDVPEFVLAEPGDLLVAVAEATRSLTSEITDGTIAVVAPDSMVDGVSQALEAGGLKAPVRPRIRDEIWLKLWGNLSFNPVSVLTQGTLLQLATDNGTRKVIRGMMQEARLVGEALGVKFSVDVDERIAMAEKVGNHRTSMLQDVEAGRPTELDSLLGVVIELAQMVGIATPSLNLVYDLTKFRSKT